IAKTYKKICRDAEIDGSNDVITAYRNDKNLGRQLTSSRFQDDNEQGAFRGCAEPRCQACRNHAPPTSKITSTTYKKQISIKNNITCATKNIIYVITCNRCKMQYVGETGRCLRE